MTDLVRDFSYSGPEDEPESGDPLVSLFARQRQARDSIALRQSADPEKTARANVLSRETGIPATLVEGQLPAIETQRRIQKHAEVAKQYPAIGRWSADPRNLASAADDYDNLGLLGKAIYGIKNVGSSLKAGLLSGASGVWGTLAGLGENLDVLTPNGGQAMGVRSLPQIIADFSRERQAEGQAMAQAARPNVDNWFARNLLQGVESVPLSLAAVGAGVAGSPGAGVAVFAGSTAGNEYAKARQAGLSPARAGVYATGQGVAEYVTERLPVGMLAGDIATKTPFIKTLFRQLAAEIPGEQAATLLQDFNEWATLHPEKTLRDFISERPAAAAETLVATIGGTGFSTSLSVAAERTTSAGARMVDRVVQSRDAKAKALELDKAIEGVAQSKLATRDPEAFSALLREMAQDADIENVYIPAETLNAYMQMDGYDGRFDDFSDAVSEGLATGGDVVIPFDAAVPRLATAWESFKDDVRLSPGGMTRREALTFDEAMADVMADLSDKMEAEDRAVKEAAAPRDTLFQSLTDKLMNAGFTPSTARAQAELLTQRAATRSSRLGKELTGEEYNDFVIQQVLPETIAAAQKADQLDMAIAVMKKRVDQKDTRGKGLLDFIAEYGGVEDKGGDIRSMGGDKWHIGKPGKRKLIRGTSGEGQMGILGADGTATGFGLDDMAMRAWEAGYFPEFTERPTVNDLLEAIGEGIAGRDRYTQSQDATLRDAANELRALLENRGVDPDKASRKEIRAAVDAYAQEQALGLGYDQLPATIDVDGVQRSTVNSNGDPLAQTEDGVRAFWTWFGDSKVVDAEGRPLVVYHGAPDARDIASEDGAFKSFDQRYGGDKQGVHWFAKDRATARTYADDRRAFDYQAAEPGVIEAYLKLDNPEIVDGKGQEWMKAQSRGRTSNVIDEALRDGNDGVIIYNVMDNYNQTTRMRSTTTYAVFSDTQIKSVNNHGTFDPADPRILYQGGEDAAWASTIDKIVRGDRWHIGKPGKRKLIRDTSGKGQSAMFGIAQAGGHGLDDVALRAWDAGYFPEFAERPTINDLMDAIAEGIAGRDRYSSAQEKGLRDAADELRALLEQRGIDPDKASRKEIRDALAAYTQEQAQGGMSPGQRASLGGSEAVASDYLAPGNSQLAQQRTYNGFVDYESTGEPVWDAAIEFRRAFIDLGENPGGISFSTNRHGEKSAYFESGFGIRIRVSDHQANENFRVAERSFDYTAATPGNAAEYIRQVNENTRVRTEEQARLAREREETLAPFFAEFAQADGDQQKQVEIYTRAKQALGEPLPPARADRSLDRKRMVEQAKVFVERSYEQSFADGPRGRISFPTTGYGTGKTVIELFQSRDQSTFLHETGHLWLEELRFDASDPNAPEQLKADWQTVQDWFASQGHPIADGAVPVDAHEMWARGVERYLMEGKSPTPALRKMFETFKSWLVQVYRLVGRLNAPITDDIRAVMDRLIATDREIQIAREEQSIEAAFTEKPSTMSEDEWTDYQRITGEAKTDANDKLLAKVMAQVKRRVTREYQERRAEVETEVAAEIDARPEFRALRLLKETPLDAALLRDLYGEDVGSMLPKQVPPILKDGGVNPDEVAELSGFKSGDEMVRTLMGVETRRRELREGGDLRSVRKALIDQEVNSRMEAQYGDPFTDGSIEEEALAAVHNEKQGEVLAAELRVLSRSTGERPTPYSVAKAWAARTVREGVIRDVVSKASLQRYQRASAKSGKASVDAILKGDMAEAFRQKQAQMLNNALVSEASKVAEEVEKAQRRLEKIATKKTIKSVDQDYLERAQALMEQVDLRPRSQRSIDRQAQFEAWAEEQRAMGHDIVVPGSFAASLGSTHWTRLSVEQFIGLDAAVDQIIHLGRLKQALIDNQERREFDAVRSEALSQMGGMDQRPPSDLMESSRWDGIKERIAGFDAALLKMETVFDWLDQKNPNGVFNRIVFRPIAEAQANEQAMLRDYVTRVHELTRGIPKETAKRWQQKFTDPRLINRETGNPWVLTRDQLIAIALNVGNASNRAKLAGGYGWNEQAVMDVLNDNLTADEWRYVQNIWDTIESLWPQIEGLEKRVNGIAPEKIDPEPIETSAGMLRGGYYPVVYDPRLSVETELQGQKSGDALFENNYTRAATSRGFTKERTNVERPIHLSLGVIERHLSEVIHDLTHREAIMQADKFLSDRQIVKAVDDTLGPEVRRQFRPWLQHIANEWAYDRAGMGAAEKFLRGMRRNTTFVGMAFRASTMFMQVAGLSDSTGTIGEKAMLHGLSVFAKNPNRAIAFVLEKSPEVRARMDTLDRDIRENARRHAGEAGVLSAAQRFGYIGIGFADRLVVVPTWIGAYDKAMSQGLSEADAVYAADKAVRVSQGSGAAKDLAAIQRGRGPSGEAFKLMTMFYSYASGYYQRLRTLGRDVRKANAADIPNLVARSFWLIIVPALLAELLAGRGPDDDDDESWASWAFEKIAVSMFNPIPIARDVAPVATSYLKGKPTFGYSFTPVARAFETALSSMRDAANIIRGEETKRATRNFLEATGYLTGLVPGQAATSAQFLVDVAYGDQDPETFGEWYEGLSKGKVKD